MTNEGNSKKQTTNESKDKQAKRKQKTNIKARKTKQK